MSEKCHGHADTFSQNKHNIYGYTDSKGLKITCQNIQHVLPKLDEIKYNIGNMKDKFKPHILGMCETFLNEEKCKMNSRELDLDNFTYNRKDRTNKNGGGWIVYFHDYVKYERRVELESENTESMWFEIFPKTSKVLFIVFYI
jgi:hypothetical protein